MPAVYPYHSFGAGYLDPVVLRVMAGIDFQLRRINDLEIADSIVRKPERDDGLGVEYIPVASDYAPDVRVNRFRVSHEMPRQRELVVSVIKYERTAARHVLVLTPLVRPLRDRPFGSAFPRIAFYPD